MTYSPQHIDRLLSLPPSLNSEIFQGAPNPPLMRGMAREYSGRKWQSQTTGFLDDSILTNRPNMATTFATTSLEYQGLTPSRVSPVTGSGLTRRTAMGEHDRKSSDRVVRLEEELWGQLNRFQEQVQGEFDQVEGQVDQVQGHVSQVQGQVDQVQGQVDQVQGQVNQVQGQVDQVQGKVDQLHKLIIQQAALYNSLYKLLHDSSSQ